MNILFLLKNQNILLESNQYFKKNIPIYSPHDVLQNHIKISLQTIYLTSKICQSMFITIFAKPIRLTVISQLIIVIEICVTLFWTS